MDENVGAYTGVEHASRPRLTWRMTAEGLRMQWAIDAPRQAQIQPPVQFVIADQPQREAA